MINNWDDIFSKNLDKLLDDIKKEYNRLKSENKALREENAHLKEENYKDKELAKLKEKNEKLSKCCFNYGLDEDDYNKMISWWEEHNNKKHKKIILSGKEAPFKTKKMPQLEYYHFEITPTHVGTCYTIKCSCGESFDIFY